MVTMLKKQFLTFRHGDDDRKTVFDVSSWRRCSKKQFLTFRHGDDAPTKTHQALIGKMTGGKGLRKKTWGVKGRTIDFPLTQGAGIVTQNRIKTELALFYRKF